MKKTLSILTAALGISLFAAAPLCYAADPVKIEFEDFLSEPENADFSERASNDKTEKMVIPNAKLDSAAYTVTFEIPEAGEYEVSLIAAAYTEASPLLANLSWDLDGETLDVQKDFTVSVLEEGKGYIRSAFELKKTEKTSALELSKGEHTLVLTGTKVGTGLRFGLDSVTFTKWEKPKPTCDIVSGNTRIEIENVTQEHIQTTSGASGGKLYYLYWVQNVQEVSIPFYVEKGGSYNLNIAAACSFSNSYISKIAMVIDGGDEIDLTSNNFTGLDLGSYGLISDYKVKQLCYKNTLSFSEGYHNLTLKLYVREFDGDGVYAAVDFVEFRPEKDLSGMKLAVENGYTALGRSARIELQDANGEEISNADIGGEIVYTSGDESIAYVEKATVVGVRYGEGTVNVSLDRGRDSYSATGKFYVTNEKGIYISSAEKNGNELKLTFCANKDYAGGDSIRIYVFGKTDGMLRSIKKAYTVSAPALSGGGEAELSQTVEAEAGDTVGIFLFDASNDKLSQYQQILR